MSRYTVTHKYSMHHRTNSMISSWTLCFSLEPPLHYRKSAFNLSGVDPMPAFTRGPTNRQATHPLPSLANRVPPHSPSFLQAPACQPTPYPTLILRAQYHKPSLVISYISPFPTLFYSDTILIRSKSHDTYRRCNLTVQYNRRSPI